MRDEIYHVHDVIAINGRPALVTNIEHGSCVYYSWINKDGGLEHGHYFHDYDSSIKIEHIDHVCVRTVVDLPEDWQKQATEFDRQNKEKKDAQHKIHDDHEPEAHPSYGVINYSHVSGSASLFMSPFRHQNHIMLEIRRAKRHRSLSNDYAMGEGVSLVRLYMSEAQWARFICTPNRGEGTPCTLGYIGQTQMADCPQQHEVKKFHDDIERRMKEAFTELEQAVEAAKVLKDSKTATKKERQEVLARVETAHREMVNAVPFVIQQLHEKMDKVVADGQIEIEAFWNRITQQLGVQAIAEKVKPLRIDSKE